MEAAFTTTSSSKSTESAGTEMTSFADSQFHWIILLISILIICLVISTATFVMVQRSKGKSKVRRYASPDGTEMESTNHMLQTMAIATVSPSVESVPSPETADFIGNIDDQIALPKMETESTDADGRDSLYLHRGQEGVQEDTGNETQTTTAGNPIIHKMESV